MFWSLFPLYPQDPTSCSPAPHGSYLGWQDDPERPGLRLAEASEGSLQHYLERHHDNIPASVRSKWCRQVVEAISYIHSHGIIHSDLRSENFLVHATAPDSLDLWLCDFGGAYCERLRLDGGHLPDEGFWDPNAPWESVVTTDLFSVGSILYHILTGHWPHGPKGPFERTPENVEAYRELVDNLFRQGQFPNVDDIDGGRIIRGCWKYAYATADEILKDLDSEDT